MKMHFLSGGRVRMRKATFIPGTDRSETIELPVMCTLLRHRQGNVLFDTGCHPDVPDDPAARWHGMEKFMVPIMPKGDNVLTGLKAVGVEPDDIDVVVCSHLHPDHCGCNAFFKKAIVMVHADEVAAARAPDAVTMGFLAGEWDVGLPRDELDGQRDVFGDERIVLIPLPGHTRGSMGARVALDRDGTFLLAADTVTLRSTLDTGVIPRNTWNGEALTKSLAEVARIERQGATVICGHDDAQWQTLRKGADAYE
jgi:glyoxylase-like metal-dependent hydrolase (beta-lactamase superfamily II)